MSYFGPSGGDGFKRNRMTLPGGARFGFGPFARPELGFRSSPRGGFRGSRPRGRGVPVRSEINRMGTSKPPQISKTGDEHAVVQDIKTEPDAPNKSKNTENVTEDKTGVKVKEEPVEDVKPDVGKSRSEPVKIKLDSYNSELHVHFEEDELTASIMRGPGFEYMWGGARATHGVTYGKVCFEVHMLENQEVDMPDEKTPHVTRIGWSVDGSDYQLGEDKLSWGYGGTGKSAYESKFRDYGKPFGVGDVVTCYIDLDATPKAIFYMVNGEYLGVAFRFTNELGGRAVYPHVTCKNMKVQLNFGEQPSKFPLTNGFTMLQNLPMKQLISPPPGPSRPEEAEVIMMVGLPACGKSFWCEKYAEQHPDKKYYILGTNVIIDRMKVSSLTRKRNYHGRWEELIKRASVVLNKLFDIAKKRPKNYILDQTNVYFTARRRKMESFRGYKRIAAVLVNKPAVLEQRKEIQMKIEGKVVPEEAIMEMKRNFTLPEIGPSFDDVWYLEELQPAAREFIEGYRREGEEFKKNISNASDVSNPPAEKKPLLDTQSTPNHETKSTNIQAHQNLMEIDTSSVKPPPTNDSEPQESHRTPTRPGRQDNRYFPGSETKQDYHHYDRGDYLDYRYDDRDRSRDDRMDVRDRRDYRDDRRRDFYHKDDRERDHFWRDDRNHESYPQDVQEVRRDRKTEYYPTARGAEFHDFPEDQSGYYRDVQNRYPSREREQFLSRSAPREHSKDSLRSPIAELPGDNYLQDQYSRTPANRREVPYLQKGRNLPDHCRYPPAQDHENQSITDDPQNDGFNEQKPKDLRHREFAAWNERFGPGQPNHHHPKEDRSFSPEEKRSYPPQQNRTYAPQEDRVYRMHENRDDPRQDRGYSLQQERDYISQDRALPQHYDRGFPARQDGDLFQSLDKVFVPLQDRDLPQRHDRRSHPDYREPITSGRSSEYGGNQDPHSGVDERREPHVYRSERQAPLSDRNQSYKRNVSAAYDHVLPDRTYGSASSRQSLKREEYPETIETVHSSLYKDSPRQSTSTPQQPEGHWDRPSNDQNTYVRPMYSRDNPPRDMKHKEGFSRSVDQSDRLAPIAPIERNYDSREGYEQTRGSEYFNRLDQPRMSARDPPITYNSSVVPVSGYYKNYQDRDSNIQSHYNSGYRDRSDNAYRDPDIPSSPKSGKQGVYEDRLVPESYDRKPYDQSTGQYPLTDRSAYGDRQIRSDTYKSQYDGPLQQRGDVETYKQDYNRSVPDDCHYQKERSVERDPKQRVSSYDDERQASELYRHPTTAQHDPPKPYSAAVQPSISGADYHPYVYTSNTNQVCNRSHDQISSSYQTQMTTSTANYSRQPFPLQYTSEQSSKYQSQSINQDHASYKGQASISSQPPSDVKQPQAPAPPQDPSAKTATSYEQQQEDYQKAYSQWYANYAQAFAQIAQAQNQKQ